MTKEMPVKVLLVEDNDHHAELVCLEINYFAPTYRVQRADQLSKIAAMLEREDFDVLIMDMNLPDAGKVEMLAKVGELSAKFPIVVLTSLSDQESAMEALQAGAQDFLVKDEAKGDVICRSIKYAIERQKAYAQNQDLLRQLKATNSTLDKKNRQLADLYKTAHQFVDNVSHEFRTPLTVIKEFASILRDGLAGDINAEQAEYLDIVADRVLDLTVMVNDMLDISKLEAGLLGISRKQCSVSSIVESIIAALNNKSASTKVSLEYSLPENLPDLFCDPEKIGRVIINLATNAMKFCNDGGHVRLWAKHDPEQAQIIIGVTDNGPGISPENLEAIFERFRQIEGNIRASTKGFGLGLNIAKELVDLNLGEIFVDSRLGEGSTFSFSVPTAAPAKLIDRYMKRVQRLGNGSCMISLVIAHPVESVSSQASIEVGEFLNHLLRHNDLAFQTKEGAWLLVIGSHPTETNTVITRIKNALIEGNRNRPEGPLPDLRFENAGTWYTEDQREEFISAFLKKLEPEEMAHA